MIRIPLLAALAILLLPVTAPLLAAEEPVAETPTAVTSLEDVTVTETRTPREVESLTGSGDVVKAEEIREKGSWSLEEALTEYTGVDVVGKGRYGQEVRLNTRGVTSGYGTQRTLVLLDGRPILDEYLGNVDLAQFPLSIMRRAEFVRGPSSAAYGTNALGGVLNLIPGRGTATQRTEVFGEYGSFNSRHFVLNHGAMYGSVDGYFGIDEFETDGYLKNDRGDDMDWSAWTGFLNVGVQDELYDVRGYLYLLEGEGTDLDYDREVTRIMGDLTFSFLWDAASDAEMKLKVYRSQLDSVLAWFDRPESDFDQVTWGAILTQTYRVHPDHLLLGGIEWRRADVDTDEVTGSVQEVATTWSFFLQDEWQVTPDVWLVGGARYDKRTDFDGDFSWRLGANWKITEETIVRAAGGKAFRAPTISDQYLPPIQFFGMTFEGNPDLEPEVLYSVEAGVDQKIGERVTLVATGFASSFEDFWDFLRQDDGVFRPTNIGKVRIFGLETALLVDIGAGFFGTVSYTFTDATYTDFEADPDVEGNRLDDNVRHRGSAAVVWRHPEGHTARLGAIFSGDRFTDPENTEEGRLDSWITVDFQAEARLTDWASLTLNVQNILDEDYATRETYAEPGRAAFVGVRLTF